MTEQPRIPRRYIAAAVAVAAVVAGSVTVGGWELHQASTAQRDRIEDLEDTAAERGAESQALAAGLDDARSQMEAEGVEPAVPPAEDIVDDVEAQRGPVGPQGERGRRGLGPSDAQVSAAVSRYCVTNGCIGPRGPAPTATQVAAAVADYCAARGECVGPTGAAGTDGSDGSTGDPGATGPQGPGPTSGQIAAEVASYCAANNGCRGPTGPAGEDGEDSSVPGPVGPQGPAGPTCPGNTDPVQWTVEERHAVTTGLDPGTYLVCRAQGDE